MTENFDPQVDHVLVELDERGRQQAMTLFAKNIAAVRRSSIGGDDSEDTRSCVEFMGGLAGHLGHDVMWHPHQWRGVYLDGRLAGAVHASPKVQEGAEVVQLFRQGPPVGPPPRWIERFLNTVLCIEEIAVHPDYRRLGIARALLSELHAAFYEHVEAFREYAEEEGVEYVDETHANVVTHASTAAQPLFASLGYTVGAPRTPVPPEYMAGLTTLWSPAFNHVDGTYCYRHL